MLVFVFVVAVFAWIVVASSKAARTLKRQMALETSGLRGRALVLASDRVTTSVTINAQRFEQRTLTLDVEIAGREPYTTRGQFLIARGLVEPVPGSSLDVAVDPSDPNSISVLGPGGFSGPWIRVGMPNPY